MKKIMILLAVMAMATLSIQAKEHHEAVEITTTAMEADAAVAEEIPTAEDERPTAEDEKNTTKEATYNEAS